MILGMGALLLLVCIGSGLNAMVFAVQEQTTVMQQQYVMTNYLLFVLSLIGVMLAVGLHKFAVALDRYFPVVQAPPKSTPPPAPKVQAPEPEYKSLLR